MYTGVFVFDKELGVENEGSTVAQRAEAKADKAALKIQGHEDLCTYRWTQILSVIERLQDRLDKQQKEILSQAALVRAGLDAIREDANQKFIQTRSELNQKMETVYKRLWWFASLFIAAQSAAIAILVSLLLKWMST